MVKLNAEVAKDEEDAEEGRKTQSPSTRGKTGRSLGMTGW